MTSPRAQRHRHIPTTTVNDTLGQDCTKLGHDIIMLVIDDFGIEGSEVFHFRTEDFSLLDENHCRRHEGTLAHIVHRVLGQGLDESNCILWGNQRKTK